MMLCMNVSMSMPSIQIEAVVNIRKRRPKFGLLSRSGLSWTWTSRPSSAPAVPVLPFFCFWRLGFFWDHLEWHREVSLLEFQWRTSTLKNSTTPTSPEEPFVLDIGYTLGDEKQQHFNKANILVDMFQPWAGNLEMSLQNEPETILNRKTTNSSTSSSMIWSCIQWAAVMIFHGWTTSTTSPSWKVDALVAQIAPARDCQGTTLGLTFGILKCLSFVLRTASTQRLNRWKPLDQVFRLFGWADFMERPFGRHLNLRIQLRGCHSNRVSQAQISRELVIVEKNTVDRFLNFFGRSLERTGGKVKKDGANGGMVIIVHIWVVFPRTGKMSKICQNFFCLKLHCDQTVWFF